MKTKNVKDAKPVEGPSGFVRRTLSYNDEEMLCYFHLKKGSELPLHSHLANQIGYILKGKMQFLADKPEDQFTGEAGDSYVFDGNFRHGVIALEDAEYIEVFTPVRDEFNDS